ncbi:MAG: leucyl aminopeptidase family protein [Patescibacteria group bacterium]|nr:leucyl aminopeptidase family protein [Patescibacteria group bacterium]
MVIKVLENLNKDKTLILVIKENDLIKNHPFWNFFNIYDQKYILNFLKNNKINSSSVYHLFLPSNREIVLVGEVKKEKFNHRKAIILARKIIQQSKNLKKKHIILTLNDFKDNSLISDLDLAKILGIQFEIANFEFIEYKTLIKNNFFIEEIQIMVDKQLNKDLINKALEFGQVIGLEINEARKLSNTPGGEMTPQKLADAAKQVALKSNIKVKILNEKQIRKIGMFGILGVAQGSIEKPKFIIMEYFGEGKDENPVVLVGKGVTFDTGGLNLKPADGMYEMHMDMSGGASVIHIISALAKLKIKKNIIGLIPAVENMPSGSSYRPGDLLKSLSGKTIEVLNTDAEGRIILADALTYAQKFYNPSLIIDLATLTGAAMVALGQRASAIFSNNEDLIYKLQKAGEEVGDFVWPLPLWEEYEKDILGTFGDISNAPKNRYGGAIAGAMFLYQFVKNENNEISWIHIDIAPRMTSIDGDYLAKGSVGPGIALIFWFINKFL